MLIGGTHSVDKGAAIGSILQDTSTSPSQFAARNEAEKAVEVAIAALAEDQQQAIRLYYFEGKSMKEIGALMGLAEGTVSRKLTQAREALQSKLGTMSMWRSTN